MVQGLGFRVNRENGKENGNYYNTIGYILGLYGGNGKKMETTIIQ